MSYHCPNCGKEISFGESICPNCQADVTNMWEQVSSPKNTGPKIVPGMGGMENPSPSPFPPISEPTNSPFPPSPGTENSPFPSAPSNISSPFPTPNAEPLKPSAPTAPPFPSSNDQSSPFNSPSKQPSPFSSPTADQSLPEPNQQAQVNSTMPQPFPPTSEAAPFPPNNQPAQVSGPYLEIPRIGAKLIINENPFRIGRDEIQGAATKALPDLNAYRNISRKRPTSEHFIIHNNANQYSIEDTHSTNGTYVGTTKLGPGVPPQPLRDGEKIIIPIEEFGKMVQLEVFFRMQ
ncbi:MAG: FHA domain-containing protein [Promethearchaeota archaeon]